MLRSSRLRRALKFSQKALAGGARTRRIRQLMAEHLEQRTVLAAVAAPHELLVQFQPGIGDEVRTASLSTVHGSIMESLQKQAGGASAPNAVQRIELPTWLSLDDAINALK